MDPDKLFLIGVLGFFVLTALQAEQSQIEVKPEKEAYPEPRRVRVSPATLPKPIRDSIDKDSRIRFAYRIIEGDELMYEVTTLKGGISQAKLFDVDVWEIVPDQSKN